MTKEERNLRNKVEMYVIMGFVLLMLLFIGVRKVTATEPVIYIKNTSLSANSIVPMNSVYEVTIGKQDNVTVDGKGIFIDEKNNLHVGNDSFNIEVTAVGRTGIKETKVINIEVS